MVLAQVPFRDHPHTNFNDFGTLLFDLMAVRGVRTASELQKVLNDTGFRVSRQTITNYSTGHTPVATPFVKYVARALGLNKGERQRLAWAACYGD